MLANIYSLSANARFLADDGGHLALRGPDRLDWGEVIGYTTIIHSLQLVFVGIRSYRANGGGGQITFPKAVAVGISITLILCVFYVATWKLLYFNFMPGFMDRYGAYMVE